MRRALALFLGLLMLLTTLPAAAFAEMGETPEGQTPAQVSTPAGGEPISIDAAHFGDEAFCAYLEGFDTDSDGALSVDECAAVTEMDCANRGITAITGLSYFPNLWGLNCSYNTLTALDVSGCTALEQLYCCNNALTSLDVSGCTRLGDLDCSSNALTSLDVSGYTSLVSLNCSYNALTSLDVSGYTWLRYLSCDANDLTSLDVSANTALYSLHCERNALTSLDVSANTALEYLSCDNNALTVLDVSANAALETLYCHGNDLTALDVVANNALTSLSCGNNALTALDVSANTALRSLSCEGNALASLNVASNTSLGDLDCSSNALTALDVSANTALEYLSCDGNALTALDVSANTALEKLSCDGNALTALDVSANTALYSLDCSGNALTALDVSANTALETLYCYGNTLTVLDVSANTALTQLSCDNNNLASLKVATNTALYSLDCSGNALTSLDVSGCTALRELYCSGNRIEALSLCGGLETLECCDNNLRSLDVSMMGGSEPRVFYDGNPLTEVRIGADVRIGHLGVDMLPSAAERNFWQYIYGMDTVLPVCLTDKDLATATDYHADGTKTEWPYYRLDPHVTLTFNEAGQARFGQKIFSGTLSQLREMGLSICVTSDQSAQTLWQPGESHKGYIEEGVGHRRSFDVRMPSPDDVIIGLAVEEGYCLEVEQYTGGYWSTSWEISASGEKTPKELYYRYGDLNPTLTLTLSPSGAARYNGGNTTFVGTFDEMRVKFNSFFDQSGDWPDADMLGWEEMAVGDSGQAAVSVAGLSALFTVKIVPGPVAELALLEETPIPLQEGVDGRTVSGSVIKDGEWEPYSYFEYTLPGAVRCAATFTDAGAAQRNGGDKSFTGTVQALGRLLGTSPKTGSAQSYDYLWHKGETYPVVISVPGAMCRTEVEIVGSYVAGVSLASAPPQLYENAEGYWRPNPDGGEVFVYFSSPWGYDAEYTVTFTDEGAAYYGHPSLTGTLAKIEELFGGDAAYFSGEQDYWDDDNQCVAYTPWLEGETYTLTLHLMGSTCEVPVTIVANPVAGVAPAFEGPVELVENSDGHWETNPDGQPVFVYNAPPWGYGEYTVTFTDEGAAQYGRPSFTGTLAKIDEFLGGHIAYFSNTQVYWDSDNQCVAFKPWSAGETYTRTLDVLGSTCPVDVEIVGGFVESIVPDTTEPLVLIEDWDGDWDTMDGQPYFRYNIDPWWFRPETPEGEDAREFQTQTELGRREYTVTFSAEGAERFHCASFHGTLEEIYELTGLAAEFVEGQDGQTWVAGSLHTLTLSLMGKSCQVPVEIVPSPIKSIAPVMTMPLALIAEGDGWWSQDSEGNPVFCYNDWAWSNGLNYAVVFTDTGAQTYGCRSFVGTLPQIVELTGAQGQFDGTQSYWNQERQCEECTAWEVGSQHWVTLRLLGASCRIPLTVVDSPLSALAMTDGTPVELERMLDGFWAFDYDMDGGCQAHFFYDILEKRVWDEVEQDWVNVPCQVRATFTDMGMALYGVARSGVYDLFELLRLQNNSRAENITPYGENWEDGEHTVTLRILGRELCVPVNVVSPRVELTELSVSLRTEDPLVAGDGANSDLWTKLNYHLTYREAGSAATQTGVMTGLEIFNRWGVSPYVYANKPVWDMWEQGRAYELSAGLMNLTATATAVAQEDASLVALTEENFPDAGLREYLSWTLDGDGDGFVSADSVLRLECYGQEIGSLRGIERFTKLKNLICIDCAITSLDLRPLEGLTWVDIQSCPALTELDVSDITTLTHVRVYDCPALRSLDVSGCTALRSMSVCDSGLTALDASDCTALVSLHCENDAMESLDVSGCAALQYLRCRNNRLTSLDVTNNTALALLECGNNRLTSLDVTKNTRLKELYCDENGLGQLDVTKNAALETLVCAGAGLTSLDVTKNTALEALDCSYNTLSALDVSANTRLRGLECSETGLPALNVSANTALTHLYCGGNGVTTLDVSANAALLELDVSRCAALTLVCLHHAENVALGVFQTSPELQIMVGSRPVAKKPIFASNSSLGDSERPLDVHIENDAHSLYTLTDNNGVVFGDLAGQYTVTVSKEGYVPRTFAIDLDADTAGVQVKIVQLGDLNGIAGVDLTGHVDENDCQRIYEVLNGEKPLETDGNLGGDDLAYARQVADTNGDGQLNILDFQSLYEDVVARREQGQ